MSTSAIANFSTSPKRYYKHKREQMKKKHFWSLINSRCACACRWCEHPRAFVLCLCLCLCQKCEPSFRSQSLRNNSIHNSFVSLNAISATGVILFTLIKQAWNATVIESQSASCLIASLEVLDRNYWHHLNYLEPANIRIIFCWPVQLNLNDYISIHMQEVFSLQERRCVSCELGLSSHLAFFVRCFTFLDS